MVLCLNTFNKQTNKKEKNNERKENSETPPHTYTDTDTKKKYLNYADNLSGFPIPNN
jgi:hypothetical protein